MSDTKLTRRSLFSKESKNTTKQSQPSNDPLFQKYSKKKAGRVNSANPTNKYLRVEPNAKGLVEYTGPWTVAEVSHLLRRCHFGGTKADTDALLALSPAMAVDSLFAYNNAVVSPHPTPVNNYDVTDVVDVNGIPIGGDWTQSNITTTAGNANTINSRRNVSLRNWIWGTMLTDTCGVREKLIEFWFHFIPVNNDTGTSNVYNFNIYAYDYRQLLKTHAQGNFKTLIMAISKTPAMIHYLSGQSSTRSTPNENFARELFELFTLGKEEDDTQNKYTEADIKAASKVFSGWRWATTIGPYPTQVAFNATYHNQENKTFSSHFGNTTINNQLNADGANEFDLFFDMLFTQQAQTIARYIVKRMYRYFVYYEIDTATQTNIINPLAQLLIDSNWETGPVFKKLFKSEHFFDVINRGVMIKSPFDLLVGMVRTFKINLIHPDGPTAYIKQKGIWDYFQTQSSTNMLQAVGAPPNVAGWGAYYQAPGYYQNWISAYTIQRREIAINNFVNGVTLSNYKVQIDPILFVQQWPNDVIRDADALINAVISHVLPFDLDTTFKTDTLRKADLLNNQIDPYYWTNAWDAYLADPASATKKNLVLQRLRAFISEIMKLAEFQLM
jgi:uncharacterized protein (DUF1800 family)